MEINRNAEGNRCTLVTFFCDYAKKLNDLVMNATNTIKMQNTCRYVTAALLQHSVNLYSRFSNFRDLNVASVQSLFQHGYVAFNGLCWTSQISF
jgi:hypothetical protein